MVCNKVSIRNNKKIFISVKLLAVLLLQKAIQLAQICHLILTGVFSSAASYIFKSVYYYNS